MLSQVIRAKSDMGWSFEFSLRPSSDLALYDKYSIAEYVQVGCCLLQLPALAAIIGTLWQCRSC